jgi:hypothetical protein
LPLLQARIVHNSVCQWLPLCDKIAGYFLTTEHAINILRPALQEKCTAPCTNIEFDCILSTYNMVQNKSTYFKARILNKIFRIKLFIHVRFEVFTAVTMKNGVFLVVTPCGSCKNRSFGGTWRLLHQGDKNR